MNSARLRRLFKLDPGEEIVSVYQQHKIRYFWYYVLLAVFILAAFLIAIFFGDDWGWWAWVAVIILIVSALVALFISSWKWNNTVFVLTNYRLIDISQQSVFNRQIAILDLDKMEEIFVESNWLMKALFNCGSLRIFLPNGTMSLRFDYLAEPEKTQAAIYRQGRGARTSNDPQDEMLPENLKEWEDLLRTYDKDALADLVLKLRRVGGWRAWQEFLRKELKDKIDMSFLNHHQVGESRYLNDSEMTGIFKILNSQVLFVILTALLLVFLSSFTRDFSQKRSIDGEVETLQAEIKSLEDKHTYELALINYYESDEYLALEAKSVLDMKLQGEKAVVLTENEVDKILQVETPYQDLQKDIDNDKSIIDDTAEQSESRWRSQGQLWWSYFFN